MIFLKYNAIEKLIAENNGILKTADVVAAGISKETFYKYVKYAGLEKAAHGIYLSPDCLTDELYLLQVQFPKAVYSHEAALYLHDLAEKEPIPFSVTVPASYNSGGLIKKGVKAYYVKKEWYDMGICEIQTPGGHFVKAYDMERTICDILRKRQNMDISVFNYAVKEYMKRKDKRISVLSRYAVALHIEKQMRETMGVLF